MCAAPKVTPRPSPMVAIVDDDLAARRALSRMLRGASFRVAAFSGADELLDAFQDLRPECLVVDVALHGTSGPDLVERLRSTTECPPVIFVTGRLDVVPSLKQRGLSDVPLLQKPFEPSALIGAIARALESGQTRHG